MEKILNISDFTGIYELPISDLNEDRATAILNKVEAATFRKMMGDDSYRAAIISCIDDVEGFSVQNNSDFYNFFYGVEAYEVGGTYKLFDEGFKQAILSFAWFEIMKDFHQFGSSSGILESINENSQQSTNRASVLATMWNNGVRIYNESYSYVQNYMIDELGLDTEGQLFENLEHLKIEEMTWI